jgi:hypothetical protein
MVLWDAPDLLMVGRSVARWVRLSMWVAPKCRAKAIPVVGVGNGDILECLVYFIGGIAMVLNWCCH